MKIEKTPAHSQWVMDKMEKSIFVSTPVKIKMEWKATKFWSWWCGSLKTRQWAQSMSNCNNWICHVWLQWYIQKCQTLNWELRSSLFPKSRLTKIRFSKDRQKNGFSVGKGNVSWFRRKGAWLKAIVIFYWSVL